MPFECPECKSTLFHVENVGGNVYEIKCYKTAACGWSMKVVEIQE
jgi:hypothetical protein